MQAYAKKVWEQMKMDHSGDRGMDMNKWDWVPGVGVIAMLDYHQATQYPQVLTFLIEWVERNKEKAADTKVINSMAPYAIFPALYQLTGEEWYKEEAVRVAEWLLTEAPRTREQAFEHTVTEDVIFPEQVWADTVFMAVLFLARTASQLGNIRYAEEALQQVLIHLRLLQDDQSGVLFHGWDCGSRNHMSSARWTRANAWIAAGIPMIVEEISQLMPIPVELKDRYSKLMAGLVDFQQKDGLWSTVMDQTDYYREISGSAGIGYGLKKAMETGLIEPLSAYQAASDRVTEAVLPFIRDNGIVEGVSGGTPVMPSIEAYNEIPTYPTLYGQGLVLMLLSHALRRNEEQQAIPE
ncbi:glycoside hydrolase family 105 protein [Paenibacillus sp. N3.4]|uniref:glycoside hydrolase family 88/105 protein n=1 Tax=Paenibacillus sp. N3.4 TaxID=2603222 RepID=UPI0011C9B3DE|nr:glycoside hydrolase family 88 protein [Paenibacillus sp. N3.4]TXK84164.1 glycosyl hydrolase [Paenibacillus sp. N3.4]